MGSVLGEELDRKIGAKGLEDGRVVVDEVVNPKPKVEAEPDNNDGGKYRCDLGGSQRLEHEEQNQDSTRRTDNGRSADVWFHDFQPLDSAEHRLCRCENAVSHDHGYGENTNGLKENVGYLALFNTGSQGAVDERNIRGLVALHPYGSLFSGIAASDIRLEA